MKIPYLFCLLLIFTITNTFCQESDAPAKNLKIGLYFKSLSVSSHFDVNGDYQQGYIKSSAKPDTFIYEFNAKTIAFETSYSVNRNLTLNLNIPFTFYSLDEKRHVDTTYKYYDPTYKDSLNYHNVYYDVLLNTNKSRLDYFLTGAKYNLLNDNYNVALGLNIKIPTGSEQPPISDSSNGFLGDEPFEFFAGTFLGYHSMKYMCGLNVTYNFRAGDFSDRLIFRLEGGLATVPNSSLKLVATYVKSLKTKEGAVYFHPRRLTRWEEYLETGLEFHFDFSKDYYIDFSYHLHLTGINTYHGGYYIVGVGIKL